MFSTEAIDQAFGGERDEDLARVRWPYAGAGQLKLLLASIAILVGSFLPWVDSAVGRFSGMAGPGVWTLYAAVLGLAGSMLRRRRIVLAHALVVAVVAIALPSWQLVRMAGICGSGACYPTSGLVIVLAAGGVAAHAAWMLHRDGRLGQ